ncbi:MAG: ATPase domain-containing protein, partial [Candidatus Bathyarchaeota archaeon]
GILRELYLFTKDEKLLVRAIEVYNDAGKYFNEEELFSRSAGIFWRIAELYDSLGDNLEASAKYRIASNDYELAANKIPQFRDFYIDYSWYMKAWDEIEQAKYYHSRENYQQSKVNYENAGKIHQKLENWRYLAPNYFAWAKIEQAEELSRNEKPNNAIDKFKDAVIFFQETENNFKNKKVEDLTDEEKDLVYRILKVSDFRCKYCQARILMEKAKLLDRQGNYLDSSNSYGRAAQTISEILEKTDAETERKELEYIAILCQAWEKMALAEETTSSEAYIDAAELFERAKDYCFTKKSSLWALGNSNFCRGLATGIKYQISMSLSDNAIAKRHIKNAATNYLEAGLRNASEHAKGTLRLFDAYIFINQAESEIDPEKKTKQYQMAENLLQRAAGSFMKARQPEKVIHVKNILTNVNEEKTLAISLNELMKAPAIASTTSAFTAPTSTDEISIGLEKFDHANVQANIITDIQELKVGESFCLSVEFVNAGKEPALLTKVENFIPPDFVVVKKPEIYRIEDTTLNMKGKHLAPLKLVEIKLILQASRKGNYQFSPKVYYLDELGQNKYLKLKTIEIKVEEITLENRVTTGTFEIDSLLLGGIPKGSTIVLTGSPIDERDHLIKNFLKSGIKDDEIVFYISTEANSIDNLLKNQNFILILCNPKPKNYIPNLPNVYKLRSKTDITNLSISLTKACRKVDTSKEKRICIETVSDILITHKVEATRRWISELLTDLTLKGFTILAAMDPDMHPPDQSKAIINLFDGEIKITQSDDPLDCKKSVIVKKLRNQKYIKNPIYFKEFRNK